MPSSGAGGYVYATLDGAAAHGPGDVAGWQFTAPPGTTIAGALLYASLFAGASQPFQSPIDEIETLVPGGQAGLVENCSQAFGCSVLGTGPATEFASANGTTLSGLSGVTAIAGYANCGGGGTCAAGGAAVCPELAGDPCIASNHLYR